MRAYDYIRELPGGVRFINRASDVLMFVTCEVDRERQIDKSHLFNVATGRIDEAALQFPSSVSKKMLLDRFDLQIPQSAVLSTTSVITTPRAGDESPPDPKENPKAYNQ